MRRELKDVALALLQAKHVSIILHQKPDGDAIGSAVALSYALKDKNTELVCSTEIHEIFSKVVKIPKVSNTPSDKSDCIVVVDCSESHRTGFSRSIKKLARKNLIVLDHHNAGDLSRISKTQIIDSSYCATAEIIDDLLSELRTEMTPEISTALLMGIFTDTGGFKHSNTSQQTLSRASRLIRRGANLQKINRVFLQRLSPTQRKLWGKGLSELEINKWGIVTVKISRKTIDDLCAQEEDIFGLANTLALIEEAKIALVLIEQEGKWRGILRTRHQQVDVSKLARILGGKGHKKAAGFTATKEVFLGIISL